MRRHGPKVAHVNPLAAVGAPNEMLALVGRFIPDVLIWERRVVIS
jgi:hypothetical protein